MKGKFLILLCVAAMLTMTGTAYGQRVGNLNISAQADTFTYFVITKDSAGVKITYKLRMDKLLTFLTAKMGAGGLPTWVQINRGGVFGGSPNFYYDSVNGIAKEQFNNAPTTKTGITVNGAAQVDSINAPNGLYLPNEAGHGAGVATISNTGKVAWGAATGLNIHKGVIKSQTGSNTAFSPFTNTTADGMYQVGGHITINSNAGNAVAFYVTWTDQNNVAQSVTVGGGTVSAVGDYSFNYNIIVKNGTAVNVQGLVSNGNPINYDLSGFAILD